MKTILSIFFIILVSEKTLETVRRDYCELCHKSCGKEKSLCSIKFDEEGELEKLDCFCEKEGE